MERFNLNESEGTITDINHLGNGNTNLSVLDSSTNLNLTVSKPTYEVSEYNIGDTMIIKYYVLGTIQDGKVKGSLGFDTIRKSKTL